MTAHYSPKHLYEFNPSDSYQQHFEVALVNLQEVIREERVLKRIRKHKSKSDRHH